MLEWRLWRIYLVWLLKILVEFAVFQYIRIKVFPHLFSRVNWALRFKIRIGIIWLGNTSQPCIWCGLLELGRIRIIRVQLIEVLLVPPVYNQGIALNGNLLFPLSSFHEDHGWHGLVTELDVLVKALLHPLRAILIFLIGPALIIVDDLVHVSRVAATVSFVHDNK